MKNYFLKLLATFDYSDAMEFFQSLAPSFKYKLTTATLFLSVTFPGLKFFPAIDRLFGLDGLAFGALLIVFITELISGIGAAHIKGEQLSSMKLSRFSFKVFYYLVLIFVPYVMGVSFKNHHSDIAAVIFDWLHTFLVVQIVLENIISILENIAVITGKDKTAWINKIQDFVTSFFNK